MDFMPFVHTVLFGRVLAVNFASAAREKHEAEYQCYEEKRQVD